MVTESQKIEVEFCENKLGTRFIGNIDSIADVERFLEENLQMAKTMDFMENELMFGKYQEK